MEICFCVFFYCMEDGLGDNVENDTIARGTRRILPLALRLSHAGPFMVALSHGERTTAQKEARKEVEN